MPFSDVVSVSSLNLADVTETAGVLLAGMSRDPFFKRKLPHSQRDPRMPWNERVQKVAASLKTILKYPYAVILVAKYVPDHRIVGVICTFHIKATEMAWAKPNTEALLRDYTFYQSYSPEEVSVFFTNHYVDVYERAFKACGITGRFWHMDGICTLPGFEGKGIGSKLIDALFSRLAKVSNGPRKVFVMSNANSRRIYEDYGFKLSSSARIDVNAEQHAGVHRTAANAGMPPLPPKYFTEYYLTYDLSDTIARSRPSGKPRFSSVAAGSPLTLTQLNRILRPVQSASDVSKRKKAIKPL